jgi:hypothetical protein
LAPSVNQPPARPPSHQRQLPAPFAPFAPFAS